jgi:acetyl esterase/lipase
MKHSLAILMTVACVVCRTLPALCTEEAGTSKVTVLSDIAYKTGGDLTDYEKERCKLDLHLPSGRTGFATLVWFHGGGLKGGDKTGDSAIAHSLAQKGVAVVAANYRLSPKVTYPAYLQDAAAAVAWARVHIAEHGGDPQKVFVGGHSAGGWLTMMVGLDERYLGKLEMRLSELAGLIPVSGQTMTHYTVREERGIGRFVITADEAAPVYYGRKDTPPMLVLYAEHDMVARAAENEYFIAIMNGAGNKGVTGQLIRDRDHGSIASRIADENDPARQAILEFIRARSAARPRSAAVESASP